MKLLLDTHVFLWYISADPQLPSAFHDAIRDPTNEVYLSSASVWEAVIKYALGKLPLLEAPAEYLPRQREAHHIATLPIEEAALTHLAPALSPPRPVRPHSDRTDTALRPDVGNC
jgi:PIN domain nuclease of toxin-antitoxin system